MNLRQRAFTLFSFACLTLLLCAPSADAHLMPAEQGTLNIVDDSVFAVLSVPVSALHDFDDDGDGLLEMRELERHKVAIRKEVDERFALSDGDSVGVTLQLDLVLSPQHDASPDRASELVALKHVRFPAAPRDLVLTCDLFGSADAERQLTITATHKIGNDRATEVATFTPRSIDHHFFRPVSATFAANPLLLLLTVLVAGIGWRYALVGSS